MELAWSLYRAELSGPAPRTFPNALAGAWAWSKARADRAAANVGFMARAKSGTIAFRSMVQSPIRRSLSGPYAADRARSAGYLTSKIGH